MGAKKFNEYEYKNNNQRIRVRFLRNSEERLNPWEITNFVSRVSTYMYKIEMLNTIALAINQGIEKKNIFVLDRAYKLNGNYKDFSEIDLNTLAINRVYAIGKPVSMEPNQDLVEIKYLFESLYRVNKILYRFARKRITKEDRLDAYSVLKQKGFSAALNFIIDKAKKKLNDEERLNVSKNVETECSKVFRKYQEYLVDQEHFDDIEAKLEKSNYEELTELEKRVEKNYYKKFYEHIFILPRPVVGIYIKEESKFSILCGDHFDSNINKNTKIDLKSVTQNSPIKAIVESGCQILALGKEEKRKEELHELEKRKMELEIAKLEKENKLMEQEEVKNELDMLNKTIELKMRLDSMAETEENLGIKSMASSYANRQLCMVYNKVQNGYNEVLKTNKFIEESESIIDMKV